MTTTISNSKLINLNNYCLEAIFDYLNVTDLINICESDITLRSAATVSFWRTHSNKWTHEMDNIDHEKLLHNFGNVLTYLRVRGSPGGSSGIKMSQIVNYLHSNQMNKVIPFGRLEKVDFFGIFESTLEIEQYITHVQSLNFINTTTKNPKVIERRFPFLTTLTIKNDESGFVQSPSLFTNENIEVALSLNSDLLSLSLNHGRFGIGIDVNKSLLRFISQMCHVLHRLEIEFKCDNYYLFDNNNGSAVFAALRTCILSVSDGSMLTNFPVHFHRIETLELEIKSLVSACIIRFIMRNNSLRHLRIIFCSSIEVFLVKNDDIIALTEMPNLKVVFIQFPIAISGKNIIEFVSRCESVQNLRLKFVRSAKMVIIQDGLPMYVHNDHIDQQNAEIELKMLRNSSINCEWNWNSSIQFAGDNTRKYIDFIDIYFERKN